MKRYLLVICLVFLLLASMLPVSYAEQVSNTFELQSSSGNVQSGENITITVKGKSLADVYGAEMELAYDSTKLQYTGYSSTLSGEAFVREPETLDNKISLVFTLTGRRAGLNGDKDIFTITFKAVGNGNASVSLLSLSLLNSQPQPQTLAGVAGGEVKIIVTPTSPSTSPSPSPSPSPNSNLNVITLEAEPTDKGIISVGVTANELLKAFEQSKKESVLIQVTSKPDTSEVQVSLPAAEWIQSTSRSGHADTIKIQTDMATITLGTKVLKNAQVTESSNLLFTVARVDPATLSSEVRQKTGSQTVYDFNLMLDGKRLTHLNGGVQVEIPYILSPSENPNQVVIYFLGDDGKLEVVRNAKYNASTNMVTFKPNHFSKYVAYHSMVSFKDMDGYGWASEGVLGLAAREIIDGRSEEYYVPEGKVTRAEFVKLLVQLFGLEDMTATAAFSDVASDAWYYRSIASAQKAGLVQGKDNGSFGVNDAISREDMAVLIFRISNMSGISGLPSISNNTITRFHDLDSVSAYARDAVSVLQQSGLMNGTTEGYFNPKNASTRAQAATVVYRLFQSLN
ncbi:S-layer homology domain-containing protein [Paenibacillus sp. LjRoot153]|uniref:S-layer homology domain-containing protein n=1 Tax=Paenibacillus sp. LjRoot153 TaxID=3342270 RepID=UPI003ECF6533